ncbi:hypothetical protein J7E73_31745 [Paenibacillus albidus]|nr:hypothetical protein [Paenibacillus albidus]MBT2293587.1 hypothetical protein [Paenibacillus albidus]
MSIFKEEKNNGRTKSLEQLRKELKEKEAELEKANLKLQQAEQKGLRRR